MIGYVIMPEDVHLLLTEAPDALLAVAIQAIKISVSVQCTEKPFPENVAKHLHPISRPRVLVLYETKMEKSQVGQ